MSFEQYFEQNEELLYKFHGRSMMPMLDQERDVVVIRRKGQERLKVDDVALFRRGSRYVLHRVVEVGSGDYAFMGDNCADRETGVPDKDVLGVLIGFEHKGIYYSADDPKYLAYIERLHKTRKLRVFRKRSRICIVACIKRCFPGIHRRKR